MARKRFKAPVRKEQILDTAIILADAGHYSKVTRSEIARELGITPPAVQHHFATMEQLKRDLMRRAVSTGHARVVLQGLVANDPHAQKASAELKEKARDCLA